MWQCSHAEPSAHGSGSIMQASKLSFKMWYMAMAFMTLSNKGILAKEMQRQLGHKYYESIWLDNA